MSLKEKIKSAKDLNSETIYVDEWDVNIEIRAFSARKRLEIGKFASNMELKDSESNLKFIGSLLKESCYDPETGEQIFEESDVEWISDKSGVVLDKIVDKALRINGLEKKAVESAEKN